MGNRTNSNNRNQGTPQFNTKRNLPENKDNLDSRKKEEQDYKGDDVTHNQKPQRNKKQSKKDDK
ncbi:MAG: hypothetical protein H7Y42_15045 [Chitinophagaceae bacterium]|nr:hypothetical protein [Chitinophagaceae bacterium]